MCLTDKAFPETWYPDGHVQQNERRADKILFLFNIRNSTKEKTTAVFKQLLAEQELTYGRVMHVSIGGLADRQVLYSDYGGYLQPKYASLEILERERLVEFRRTQGRGAAAEVAYFSVSYLGIDFLRDCSPDARDAIRRHIGRAIRVG